MAMILIMNEKRILCMVMVAMVMTVLIMTTVL